MNLADVLIEEIYNLNQQNIEKLKINLDNKDKNGSWVFCLGAGVSISCGLPDWAKLLAMISGKILKSYSESYAPKNKWLLKQFKRLQKIATVQIRWKEQQMVMRQTCIEG